MRQFLARLSRQSNALSSAAASVSSAHDSFDAIGCRYSGATARVGSNHVRLQPQKVRAGIIVRVAVAAAVAPVDDDDGQKDLVAAVGPGAMADEAHDFL